MQMALAAQLPSVAHLSSPCLPSTVSRSGIHRNLHRRARFAAAAATGPADEWDVSRSCVNPVFRGPIFQEPSNASRLYVLFTSEGNVCRSILAEAIFNKLVEEFGLSDLVECRSKATKDYNVGEPPESQTIQVAEERGLKLPDGAASKMFENPTDIVEADLIIVMDKFNASDLLKQIVLQEVVDKRTSYSHKVRRLGDICKSRLIEDIDDPLYGNMGSPEEVDLVRQVYNDIIESCEGLVHDLLQVKRNLQGAQTLKEGVAKLVSELGTIDWVAPPMLQRS